MAGQCHLQLPLQLAQSNAFINNSKALYSFFLSVNCIKLKNTQRLPTAGKSPLLEISTEDLIGRGRKAEADFKQSLQHKAVSNYSDAWVGNWVSLEQPPFTEGDMTESSRTFGTNITGAPVRA